LARIFEDLYLYYNISEKDLDMLNDEIKTVLDIMKNIKGHSERVWTKKEPEVLKNDIEF